MVFEIFLIMKLEKEIMKILLKHGGSMTISEITRELDHSGIRNEGGSEICYFQVHARTFNLKELFDRESDQVKIKSIRAY